MTYYLGVDLGTTKTAAAVSDGEQTRAVQLGNHAPAVPSVAFLRDDGSLLFGDAAQWRAGAQPDRAAREFKRRLGDPVPLLLGGTPFSAQQLMALTLRWVIEQVSELEGSAPDGVVVTHPANWGPYKREALVSALRGVGVSDLELLAEPNAAALHFATERQVAPGDAVAVYDLGGGTFDVAVLLNGSEPGFELLGPAEGIESLGGMDFDEAILGYVWQIVGKPDQDADLDQVTALRRDVIAAKEHLSADLDASIRVDLGAGRRDVVIRRSEFEELIRPSLELTLSCLERSLDRAQLTAGQLPIVVLVGGSARIPLVQELIGARLGRLPVLDGQPQMAVALGAALAARAAPPPAAQPPPAAHFAPPAARPAAPPATARIRRSRRTAAAMALAIVLGGAALAAPRLLDPGSAGESNTPAPTPGSTSGSPARSNDSRIDIATTSPGVVTDAPSTTDRRIEATTPTGSASTHETRPITQPTHAGTKTTATHKPKPKPTSTKPRPSSPSPAPQPSSTQEPPPSIGGPGGGAAHLGRR